jgi:uncharacterized protein YjbI with pentapeptide repeats
MYMLRFEDKPRFEKKLMKKSWTSWLIVLILIFVIIFSIVFLIITKRTAFEGKTFWDWMNLLIIPFFLLLVVWGLNWQDHNTDIEIAKDNQREISLQHYFDTLTSLILDKDLKNSKADDDIRDIVRIKTITTIEQLDIDRKRQLLNFLSDIGLIWRKEPNIRPIISLGGAELENVNFILVNLIGAHLSLAKLNSADFRMVTCIGIELAGAKLNNARLEACELTNAELSLAKMVKAKLMNANLEYAKLRGTDLTKANLSNAKLKGTNFKGAILSNTKFRGSEYNESTIWPDGYDPTLNGAILIKSN